MSEPASDIVAELDAWLEHEHKHGAISDRYDAMQRARDEIVALREAREDAYVKGKVNGYGEGLIAGWDEARSRARKLFDSLLSDDAQIEEWRARMRETL